MSPEFPVTGRSRGIPRAGRNVRMLCMPGGGPAHWVGVKVKAGLVGLQNCGREGVRFPGEGMALRCNYPGN